MRGYLFPLDPFDPGEIESIHWQIRAADYSHNARLELLERLGFAPTDFAAGLMARIRPYWDIIINPVLLAGVSIIFLLLGKQQWAVAYVAITGACVTYDRWMKSQRDRNVDDALKRKERTNQMMTQHARLLLRYIGNVFEVETQPWRHSLSTEEQVKVDMFVFSELDNLEFVFDKSRARLIETEYALRALKIFVARAENALFEQSARRLIHTGRYNDEFVKCVQKLLAVGLWSRTRS